jgi:hypothetical protein
MARRVINTSTPWAPSRNNKTVAAGRATAGARWGGMSWVGLTMAHYEHAADPLGIDRVRRVRLPSTWFGRGFMRCGRMGLCAILSNLPSFC